MECMIGDAVGVAIPGILDMAAAGVELDEPHAFLDEVARDETFTWKLVTRKRFSSEI